MHLYSYMCLHFYLLQSPTSMCVTLEQVKRGGSMSFDDVFKMEYRMSQKFMVIMHFVLIFACILSGFCINFCFFRHRFGGFIMKQYARKN